MIIFLKEGFVGVLERGWWDFFVTNWTATAGLLGDAVLQSPFNIKKNKLLFHASVAEIMIAS